MTSTNYEQLVLVEHEGAILKLTLNRPDKSNSLHPDLVRRRSTELKEVEANSRICVVVITGAGRSFSAGLDLDLLVSWTIEDKISYLESVMLMFRQLWTLPQPVIAAVNGPCIAGGFDLAAFCDIRLAASEAVFGQAEINLGLTQVIHPLYKSIGLARAKELAMTGQNISAEEAYRIGLVNHVYPGAELMEKTLELARVIAAKPRNALFETKRLTRELIDMDTSRALEEISRTFKLCLESEVHQKRVAEVYQGLKKRKQE